MSGVHVATHVVRRGLAAAQDHFTSASPEYIAKLQHDAELYEQSGPGKAIMPEHFIPLVVVVIVTLLALASVRYTLGNVVASLAMIESPSSIAFIESRPPAYAEEPDAPLEKEPLMPAEAITDQDVEIAVIDQKPITAGIFRTIKHLQRVGGFRARWRGLGVSMIYHGLHNLLSSVMATFLGFGLFGQAAIYILVSVCLCRWHMLWTHSMIASTSSKPLLRRLVPRKECRALLLPSFVFALAQQATFILPVGMAFFFDVHRIDQQEIVNATMDGDSDPLLRALVLISVVPVTALLVAITVLLPASVTLTRIEACLLPEDQETIVPFDRTAIVGSIALDQRGGCRSLFVKSWRSYDHAARGRLLKLYAKMALVEITLAVVGLHMALVSVYVLGGERLGVFLHSAKAQLELMAIENHQPGST